MKILIDVQSLYGESQYRGIGRYVSNLITNMIETKDKGDEIYLLYNDWNEKATKNIITTFKNKISTENFILLHIPTSLKKDVSKWFHVNEENISLSKEVELLRESLIAKIKPDFVLLSSYFEVVAVPSSSSNYFEVPTGVIIYDFLPISNKKECLLSEWQENWYNSKIESIKKSDLFLCISDFVSNEAKKIFKDSNIEVQSISTASSNFWKIIEYSQEEKENFKKKYKITKPFILYTGGIDPRKNVQSLIESFSSLKRIKQDYQLLVVCGKSGLSDLGKKLKLLAKNHELTEDEEIIFTDYVSDEDLRMMYNLCDLFVFPSLGEGFGLTPLEAMKCGATVITSNSTSLPEVVGLEEAMFDPTSIESISNKINDVLTDKELYEKIKKNAEKRAELFSWEETAKKAWKYIRNYLKKSNKTTEEFSKEKFFDEATKIFSEYKDIKNLKYLIQDFANTVAFNEKQERYINKKIYIDSKLINSTNKIMEKLPKQIGDFDITYIEILTNKQIGIKNIETGKAISPNKDEIFIIDINIFINNNNSIKHYIEILKERKTKFLYSNHKCLLGTDEDFDKLSKEDKEKAVEYFKKSIEVFSKLLKISKRNEIICIDNIYVNE